MNTYNYYSNCVWGDDNSDVLARVLVERQHDIFSHPHDAGSFQWADCWYLLFRSALLKSNYTCK